MIKKIAPDKWKHFYVGIVMGIVLQAFLLYLLPLHYQIATAISFLLIAAISYGFELYSLFTGHGHYDFLDAIASVLGGIVGMAITFLFLMLP
ncbi:MAG TPA: hypothetical protein VM888_06915 [Chitinophagaceae bacterium]|nr:hypothetical protein [Chitinophagaceae bacterium]